MTTYRDRHLAGLYDTSGNKDKTVAELKDALKALDLPTTGTKDELAKRLSDAGK